MQAGLILKQTSEIFTIIKLEIGHDKHSFAGTVQIEKEIDLFGDRHDDLNTFYIKIQEANREEKYYLNFICDHDEKNCIYYFEGTNWVINYF
jgi:hypothetical protein